jgi:hypothetical protein
VSGRAIFCLTDRSIASYASGGRRKIAVQSPESERAARIHSKREMSQIGLPIAQRQRPSKQRATHEIFMASLNISWGRVRKRVSGRAIFCLTDRSIASYASGGRRKIAVQSPESERAARIHSKREMSQIGLPIAQRQRPSKQRATHEIFRLGRYQPQ